MIFQMGSIKAYPPVVPSPFWDKYDGDPLQLQWDFAALAPRPVGWGRSDIPPCIFSAYLGSPLARWP